MIDFTWIIFKKYFHVPSDRNLAYVSAMEKWLFKKWLFFAKFFGILIQWGVEMNCSTELNAIMKKSSNITKIWLQKNVVHFIYN